MKKSNESATLARRPKLKVIAAMGLAGLLASCSGDSKAQQPSTSTTAPVAIEAAPASGRCIVMRVMGMDSTKHEVIFKPDFAVDPPAKYESVTYTFDALNIGSQTMTIDSSQSPDGSVDYLYPGNARETITSVVINYSKAGVEYTTAAGVCSAAINFTG